MERFYWKNSATWRFSSFLFSGLLLITLIVSMGYFGFEYHSRQKNLSSSLEIIYSVHMPNLVRDLWITDYDAVEKTARGIARFGFISRVEVRDDSGKILAAGAEPGPEFDVISRKLEYQYGKKAVPIGSVSLFVDRKGIFWSSFGSALRLFLFQSTLSFFLTVFVGATFYRSFGKHMKRFVRFIQSDDVDQFKTPMVLKRRSNRIDEIQLLANHFNDLRARISDYVVELKEANDKLIAVNKQLANKQKKLEWSKEQLQLAVDVAVIGIWDWNFETNELNFGHGYYTMLGYEPDEFPASFENWKNQIHPDDLEQALQTAQTYLKTKPDHYENVFRMKMKSGAYKWIYAIGRIVERDHAGKAIRMIGNHMDITDRELANRKLREAERRNQALLDHSPLCHKIVNLDFNLTYMSAQGFSMLKLDYNADVYGQPYPFAFFPKAFRKKMIGSLKKVKETIKTVTMEGLARDSEGNDVWLSSTLVPVKNDIGGLGYITVVSADISEKKREERNRKQLEERLSQAQRMESIGNLAGGIAHDFNNILFPIIGMSELLLEDLPHESLERENAEEIYKAGLRGSELVKQILAFSRQSEHKMMPVRIQQILKEVMKLCRSTIPANIEITQDIQTDCSMVQADPTQIHQIVMNLLTNAYHAVESKSGKISVRLGEVDIEIEQLTGSTLLSGRYALLSVSDTGIGIDPAIMHKIFEPYFTTKEQGKGTGLGLAVAYGIVKEHHGDIKVYSELEKGTTFNVYLPLLAKAEKTSSAEKSADVPVGDEHILLVDDEEPIAKLEKQILERLGYKVTMRFNSLEILKAFKAKPNSFDLVISDMTMPNMTGERLAHELIAIRPDIPIIICTGFSERFNQKIADTSIGIKGFLMKPIIKAEMAKMVRKVLDESKGTDPP